MKKNKVRFCLILILSFSYQFFMAQTPLIFDKSIALPEETGGFAFDIMESNGYLFLHAQHKIFVMMPTTNIWLPPSICLKIVILPKSLVNIHPLILIIIFTLLQDKLLP